MTYGENACLGQANFEILEKRVLFSTIRPADFGAVTNDGKDDRAAIQAAINAAMKDDVVQFSAGQYDISGSLQIGAHRTLRGAVQEDSTLVFSTPRNQYAMQLTDASDITIQGLSLRANCGVILAPHNAQDVNILGNDFVWGYDGTYYNRLGVRVMGQSDRVAIDGNYFHDSLSSDRNVDLHGTHDTSYSHNTFYRVHDGGHIDGIHNNFSFIGNHGSQIKRMGIEIQDHDANRNHPGGSGIFVEDNVFTDWYKPDPWSFGLSVPPTWHNDVVVKNNYMSVFAPGADAPSEGWGDSMGQGAPRPGYGIEVDFTSGSVSGNTVVGPWVMGIVSAVGGSVGGAPLTDNTAYGSMPWGSFGVEGGNRGNGVWHDKGGNVGNKPLDEQPDKPKRKKEDKSDRKGDDKKPNTDEPVTEDSSSSNVAFLSDLQPQSVESGWGPVEINASNGGKGRGDGSTISLEGKKHDKGLGVAIDSTVVYKLNGKYSNFFSEMGIDDQAGNKGSMTFEVWADGKKVFDSGVLNKADRAKWVQLNVKKVKELKLVTTNAGDGDHSDLGVWASPQVW